VHKRLKLLQTNRKVKLFTRLYCGGVILVTKGYQCRRVFTRTKTAKILKIKINNHDKNSEKNWIFFVLSDRFFKYSELKISGVEDKILISA
jgi:hypothetical protein